MIAGAPGPEALHAGVEGDIAARLERLLSTLSPQRPGRSAIQPLVDELVARGAEKQPHSRRSFLHHLVGTWRILALWGQSEALCRAGLFHSVYGTQFFRVPSYDASKDRDRVRALIGAEAEEIAFLFCLIDRRFLGGTAARLHELPDGGVDVREYREGQGVRHLTPQRHAELLVLEAANLAEQRATRRGAPTVWLWEVTPLIRLAHPLLPIPSLLVAAGEQPLRRTEEARAVAAYRLAARADADDQSGQAAREACSLNPWVAEPHIAIAVAELAQGRAAEACAHIETALELLLAWGTPWDKRNSIQRWLEIALTVRARSSEELGDDAGAAWADGLSEELGRHRDAL